MSRQKILRRLNAFTPTPVYSPARACFFTGRLASQHGVHDYLSSLDPVIHHHPWLKDETTLAQLLSEAGYQTGNDIPQDESYSFGRQNLESNNQVRNNKREAILAFTKIRSEAV